MRVTLFLITLCLSSVVISGVDSSLPADKLCSTLRGQNIAHHSIRELLKEFFRSDEELSDYVVTLYYLMDERRFKNFDIVDCEITSVRELSENSQEVEYKISGHWLIFLTRSLTITDRWEWDRGKWYIIPHKILKKK